MRNFLKPIAAALARLFQGQKVSANLARGPWSTVYAHDGLGRQRGPTAGDLLDELKGVAWSCISLNASVCANYPPRLFVTTEAHQPPAKCLTRGLPPHDEARLRGRKDLHTSFTKAARIEEVVEHPLLTLLRQVNPIHNSFDLWELTQTFLEVQGKAFWYLPPGPFGVPEEIWILPAHQVNPKRRPGSADLVDYYEYRSGATTREFPAEDVIFFRYPDPRDPYLGGLSPLRAAFEQVALTSNYLATKNAIYDNQAIPSAVITPDDVVGEEERDRLENQWNAKFRRGGAGKVLVAESRVKVQVLQQSMGDLAALADMKATKEDIANAFHVPIAFFTGDTNLANLQAADSQHLGKCIHPRLTRRDEKLNEQLVPRFDPTGRLFLASEDPTPIDQGLELQQLESDLKYGVITINEARSRRGLPPVPWGDSPWLPQHWVQANSP